MIHIPVLLSESIQFLQPKPGENFIDATFGEGGHTLAIWEKIKPNGKILAFEWDSVLYNNGLKLLSKLQLMEKIKLVNKNFKKIKETVKKEKFQKIKGVIFDLGVASYHYDEANRGFAFKQEEFLDMRINPKEIKITAFEIINYFSREELIEILETYGEEKSAEKIADAIIQERKRKKITTTKELSEIVSKVKKTREKKIHPATQTFLALRTFINQELENLKEGLQQAFDILEPGGRIVIISFHGLEDRVIKEFVRRYKKEKRIKVITKNTVKPNKKEVKKNPRSRSAKLRAIEKLQ